MNKYSSSFNKWIFETYNVSSEGLGIFRIFTSLFFLFLLIPGSGLEHYRYLSSLPDDFFAPAPGPMMLLDSFPPFVVFQVIYGLILVFGLAMLVGYRTKTSSVLLGIFIFIMQGLIYSVGKVNHEILVPLVLICMAFSNWGNSYSIDSLRTDGSNNKVESWPLVLLSLFIGFMMFTSGFPKILGGWLDPSTHAVQAHLFRQFFAHEREAFLAGYAIQIQNGVFWELLDWVTIIFEIGFLVAVRKASWFRFFLVLAVFFHFSTKMLLNISFLPNFLAYAAFLNWSEIHEIGKKIILNKVSFDNKIQDYLPALMFGLIALIFFSVLKWISTYKNFLIETDLMAHESIFLFVAVIVAILISIRSLKSKVQNLL